MKNIFIGKNSKPYSITDLRIDKILYNDKLLNMYSMLELHELYKLYFGNYEYEYKNILRAKINLYDKSEAVNSFMFRDRNLWLDKATRVGLMHLANCSTEDIQLVLGDQVVTFSPEVVKEFLAKLEVYAGKCYVQTQKHLLSVQHLQTPEEIINYNYTTGYPEKITLE
jgi:transaldolase